MRKIVQRVDIHMKNDLQDGSSLSDSLLEDSPAKLILARHGQTVFNRDGRIMGRTDAMLSQPGLSGVKQMARIIQTEEPERIVSSILGRAAFTAAIYSAHLSVPVEFRAGIAELACGIWEGLPRLSVGLGNGRLRNTWTERPPGGESYMDAQDRVGEVIREIRTERKERKLLLVGHASVNRVFLRLWLNLDPSVAVRIGFPHDIIYVLRPGKEVCGRRSDGTEFTGFLMEPH